ncbi:MAG: VanZ family protein [Clostridia bacterium]|nr:VanZ family protein [Clostridia bacterium]
MTNAFERIKDAPLAVRILLLTSAVTILSFFIQSALPPAISSAESDTVSGFLGILIPEDTVIGGFIHSNIRKIGHFCEYGLLGIQLALLTALSLTERKERLAFIFHIFALIVALIDETVQIFSGRGPSVSDVWLDFLGFTVLFAFTYGIIFLKRRFSKNN